MDKLWLINSILTPSRMNRDSSPLDHITGRNCPDAAKWAEGLKPEKKEIKNPLTPIYIWGRDLNSIGNKPGEPNDAPVKPAVEVGVNISF